MPSVRDHINALTDRHEFNATPYSESAPVADPMMEVVELLRDIARGSDRIGAGGGNIDLCLTDIVSAEGVMKDFPILGSHRSIVRRTGYGGLYTVNTTGQIISPPDEARLGYSVVNYGTNGCFIYLTSNLDADGVPITQGAPVQWISGSGGSWDGKLTNILWCGTVFAQAQTGTTTLSVAGM